MPTANALTLNIYCARHSDAYLKYPYKSTSWLIIVWVKKSSLPKTFAIFSLKVNLCNWKLPQLLPHYIPTCTPILVHLIKYLCELYHFS